MPDKPDSMRMGALPVSATGWTDASAGEPSGMRSDVPKKPTHRVRAGFQEDGGHALAGQRQRDLLQIAERLSAERRMRYRYFPADLFHERAWDMLLELYIATARPSESCVKDLVKASDGPPTTAVRWIDHLERAGFLVRSNDPVDRRRVIVTITEEGTSAMDGYLTDILSRAALDAVRGEGGADRPAGVP